ncbi:tRNA (adenosine(37)-N6)-threonylcarbamoyltransferase complex ATPase subunit type 1 TsaE [Flexivirga alba]|uniref:tRNA threonylcarbamoyladenosine biosynthesis protein TsaE n=1 Tax=Flexivirga alba TaxID=702742 RepID=A0ABW2ANC7_9MICO
MGARLGSLLRAGDLVVLTGGLGAGKTTLTQGIGAGLGVRGPITSPTFVISRIHPSLVDGPALVHVDAYRLGGSAELDDLDLDAEIAGSVTVVEWGSGLADDLAESRLELVLEPDGDARVVTLLPTGRRFHDLVQHVIR